MNRERKQVEIKKKPEENGDPKYWGNMVCWKRPLTFLLSK